MTARLHPLAIVLLVLSACALPVSAPEAGGADDKEDGAGGAELAQTLAPAYRLVLTSHVVARDTQSGSTRTLDSRLSGYVVPSTTDAGLVLDVRPCTVVLPRVSGRQPTITSPDLVPSLPVSRAPAALARDESGAVGLHTESAAFVLGASLARPESDALPTDEDDSRVVDQDGDGNPGFTVEAAGFEVYLAARASFWLSGKAREDGSFAGEAELDLDVEILDDAVPFYDVREEYLEAAPRVEVQVDEDRFELTPLAAVPTSCAGL
jgi:hypothetical protein